MWSVTKVAFRFGYAKQSKNLKRYLICIQYIVWHIHSLLGGMSLALLTYGFKWGSVFDHYLYHTLGHVFDFSIMLIFKVIVRTHFCECIYTGARVCVQNCLVCRPVGVTGMISEQLWEDSFILCSLQLEVIRKQPVILKLSQSLPKLILKSS